MRSLRLTLIAAATSFALASCSNTSDLTTGSLRGKDYASLSAQLKKDMTEKEVAVTLGATPDKANTEKCTDHDGKPWTCKTWLFAGSGPKGTLRVVFYQTESSDWRVAAWDMY
jgi:hypothetical protein